MQYCAPGHALSGIKSSAEVYKVREYGRVCEPDYSRGYPITGAKKCETGVLEKPNSKLFGGMDGKHGKQVERKYSMYCCSILGNQETVGENLDDYKNYSSVSKYPFHSP